MSLLKSFGYSFKGFVTATGRDRNLRIHLVVALAVVALGFGLRISATDWCILLIMIGMVISAELFNTSIEILSDVVSKDQHPGIAKVKMLLLQPCWSFAWFRLLLALLFL